MRRTAQGPFPVETACAFEDAPGGTRVRRRDRGEPSGSSRVAAPAVAAAVRRAGRTDLRLLRAVLEARG